LAALRLEVLQGAASGVRGAHFGLVFKRAVDLVAGLVLAALAMPLMAIIALAIRIDSTGPALYRPRRLGRGGRIFSMYKFRTMVQGADEKLKDVAHLNVASGMVKIPGDPRVTRVGKWLRRSSLDELPQLLNVVLGDMSLVGPRPHDVHELAGIDLDNDARLAMRPGLTGLWQVTARTDPSYERRLNLDRRYVEHWSLFADLKIIASTVPVMLRGQGGTVVRPVIDERGAGILAELEPIVGLDARQPMVQEYSE
jgi:lipopolysaccharide/colanic/teichoic acid biosynthesis glycosyltransferase